MTLPDDLPKLRILLADDHGFIREGLKVLINAQPDMEIVGEVGDGEAAVQAAIDCTPDIVVMDISMPLLSGGQATLRLRQQCPSIKILALSMHEDTAYLRALLEAGASGYVLKRSAPGDLIQALRHVAAGGTYLDPAVASRLTTALTGRPALRGETAGQPLSEREEAVIRLIAQGYTNREVAERLGLSVKTAESYRARAMDKLGLTSRVALVRHASAQGWLSASS